MNDDKVLSYPIQAGKTIFLRREGFGDKGREREGRVNIGKD